MVRELTKVGTVQPYCECGACQIRVDDAHSDDYEVVYSGDSTATIFTDIVLTVQDSDCDIVRVKSPLTEWRWR